MGTFSFPEGKEVVCVADSIGGQRWGSTSRRENGPGSNVGGDTDPVQLAAVPRSTAYQQKPHPQSQPAAATKAQHSVRHHGQEGHYDVKPLASR